MICISDNIFHVTFILLHHASVAPNLNCVAIFVYPFALLLNINCYSCMTGFFRIPRRINRKVGLVLTQVTCTTSDSRWGKHITSKTHHLPVGKHWSTRSACLSNQHRQRDFQLAGIKARNPGRCCPSEEYSIFIFYSSSQDLSAKYVVFPIFILTIILLLG